MYSRTSIQIWCIMHMLSVCPSQVHPCTYQYDGMGSWPWLVEIQDIVSKSGNWDLGIHNISESVTKGISQECFLQGKIWPGDYFVSQNYRTPGGNCQLCFVHCTFCLVGPGVDPGGSRLHVHNRWLYHGYVVLCPEWIDWDICTTEGPCNDI